MDRSTQRLVKALESVQIVNKMGDTEFAATLGIAHITWQSIKAGRRPIRWAMLPGIATNYPELMAETALFLRSLGKDLPRRRKRVPSANVEAVSEPDEVEMVVNG